MLPKINPTATKAWTTLQQHAEEMKTVHMRDLFKSDPDRFSKYSMCLADTVFDYSKNIITDKTIKQLLQLTEECKLKDAIGAQFNGDAINETEKRSVAHFALRNFSGKPVYIQGENVMPLIKKVLRQMKTFCDEIHSGKRKGYTNKKIKYNNTE